MIRQIKGKDCESGEAQREREKDRAMKNSGILQKDVGNLYKKTNERSKHKRQVPTIDKFVEFWAGIWKDKSETPKSNEIIKQSMKDKIRQVKQLHYH